MHVHDDPTNARRVDLRHRAEREPMALAAIPHSAIARAVAAEMVLTGRHARPEQGRRRVLILSFLARRVLALLGVRRLRPTR